MELVTYLQLVSCNVVLSNGLVGNFVFTLKAFLWAFAIAKSTKWL